MAGSAGGREGGDRRGDLRGVSRVLGPRARPGLENAPDTTDVDIEERCRGRIACYLVTKHHRRADLQGKRVLPEPGDQQAAPEASQGPGDGPSCLSPHTCNLQIFSFPFLSTAVALVIVLGLCKPVSFHLQGTP